MTIVRVVYIEDHHLTRLGLQTALQQDGTGIKIVGLAQNGEDGLELLQTLLPDVALIDIGLPTIDGIELTRRFREFQSQLEGDIQGHTRIVMLTMQGDKSSVLAAFAAGADSYCMKTISPEQLIEVIHTTSEGNNWIDPSIARLVLQHAQQEAQTHKMLSRTDNNTDHFNGEVDSTKNGGVLIQGIDSDHEKLLSNDPLTERELEILHLIVQGCSNAAISERLYITVGTVKTHVRNILNKLSADDRTEAAVLALRSGLVL